MPLKHECDGHHRQARIEKQSFPTIELRKCVPFSDGLPDICRIRKDDWISRMSPNAELFCGSFIAAVAETMGTSIGTCLIRYQIVGISIGLPQPDLTTVVVVVD